VITRDECHALDATDELAPLRREFRLDDKVIYLDGNSLGPVCERTRARVQETIDQEWAEGLVTSWNAAGWMATPTRLGNRLAALIGARSGEVLVADTLTFCLAKLIGGALDQRPDRHVVLTDAANFHSDIYIVEAMAKRAGRPVTVKAIRREALTQELDDDVALVMLTHVDYRTGEMLDMKDITSKVHALGALMLWDLAHSAGPDRRGR
jgi:kynureninase